MSQWKTLPVAELARNFHRLVRAGVVKLYRGGTRHCSIFLSVLFIILCLGYDGERDGLFTVNLWRGDVCMCPGDEREKQVVQAV